MKSDFTGLQEIGPEQKKALFAELKRSIMPPIPVPEASLQMLFEAACQDSGGSQATRNFLFWLAGSEDPTGFTGAGGLELRRLDRILKNAAFEVLAWWAGPTKSDEPLYSVLRKLEGYVNSKR